MIASRSSTVAVNLAPAATGPAAPRAHALLVPLA